MLCFSFLTFCENVSAKEAEWNFRTFRVWSSLLREKGLYGLYRYVPRDRLWFLRFSRASFALCSRCGFLIVTAEVAVRKCAAKQKQILCLMLKRPMLQRRITADPWTSRLFSCFFFSLKQCVIRWFFSLHNNQFTFASSLRRVTL